MSLITDKFFYDALCNNADLKEVTKGRIFNTARPEIDEDEDKIPYTIIQNMGTQEHNLTKDGDTTDHDTITILVVAETREDLGNITTLIRETIKDAIDALDYEDGIESGYNLLDYTFSAGPIQYDGMKPCHFQELTWVCETENIK